MTLFPELLFGKDTFHGKKQVGAGTYPSITFADIAAMAAAPPSVADKLYQSWIIPSSYRKADGRTFQAQQAEGQFHMLVADADEGNHTRDQILTAIRAALGDVWFLVYETFNSCNPATEYGGKRRWRIMVPLKQAIPGIAYRAAARAFRALLTELGGLSPTDLTASRFGQISFLPNRGPFSYSYATGGSQLCDLSFQQSFQDRAKVFWHQEQQDATEKSDDSGSRLYTPRWYFSRHHDAESLMEQCGFVQEHDGKWRWPGQTSKGSLVFWPDGKWNTMSGTAQESGCGRKAKNGSVHGDAFDIWTHFWHVPKEAADCYAKALAYGGPTNLDAAAAWHYLKGMESSGRKIFDDMVRIRQAESIAIAEKVCIEVDDSTLNNDEWKIDWPPGLVGELAKWIYLSSSRPIKQYAIAASLYFFSACGRKYNVDGSGLNLFMMLIGGTGRGKGVVKGAIDRLVAEVMMESQNPNLTAPFNYEIAVSESGIRKALSKQNPICAYEEELGLSLMPLTSQKASSNDTGLRKILTRLYDSGEGKILGRKEASDQDRTRELVSMPCMTIAGDTQPHVYRALLGNNMIDSGFGPRMIPFFYYGKRKHHQEESENHRHPPKALVTAIKLMLIYWLTSGETVCKVQWAEGVKDLHNQSERLMDHRINEDQPGAEMFNRVGTTTARVAALLAVGVNHLDPIITEECYNYAREIIEIGLKETQAILATGGAGSGESVRIFKLRDAVKKFITGMVTVKTKLETYGTPKSVIDNINVINEKYLIQVLGNQSDFKAEGSGTTERNVRDTIAEAIAQGIIEPSTALVLDKRTKQTMYQVGPDF